MTAPTATVSAPGATKAAAPRRSALTAGILAREDRWHLGVYRRAPLALVRGAGCFVWDSDGRRYLDLYGGHAVALTGHCHPHVVGAIRTQAEKLLFTSNAVYNDRRAEACELLCRLSGMAGAFLVNSGTEANEAALKTARRATGRQKIVAFEGGFHGRTLGSLAATALGGYRATAGLDVPGYAFTTFGDADAAVRAIDDATAGVLIEPVQSLAGVRVADASFYWALRKRCDETGALLIADEVQTAFGRTGRRLAMDHFGVRPDIVTVAKGVASGLPFGAMLVNERVAATVHENDHGSTFGGGPLACAAAVATLTTVEVEGLAGKAERVGARLLSGLRSTPGVREVRGVGLLAGFSVDGDAAPLIEALRDEGVLVGSAYDRSTVRLLPPLVLTDEQVDWFLVALKQALATCRS